ncbi:DUF4145 domain-containing protein [Sphingobium chungbukense]|uniref:DUF4145 domain-containing protein n=1 Tax=Sphingobium chungbukense TaxID=56193 RepID=UPI000699966A|nr:DUF4145 domain-containing protein [Sphingobium chungbukense]
MAVFISKCPHCASDQMSFSIFGFSQQIGERWKSHHTAVAGLCGKCHLPVAATLKIVNPAGNSASSYQANVAKLPNPANNLELLGFALVDVWPKPAAPSAPDNLPLTVERAFLQAEKNLTMADCEEAAATMYRRALDLGLKEAFPDEKGSLDARLKRLVKDRRLPEAVGDWAHEVRVIGNDGAHDLDGVSREDLMDARNFIDTVLKYLFTLPAQIRARKPVELPSQSGSIAEA